LRKQVRGDLLQWRGAQARWWIDALISESSDLRQTSIDEQLDAGDVASVVGSEERDGGSDVFRMPNPTEWYALPVLSGHGIPRLLREPLQAGRVDTSRADDVDPDPARLEVARPGAGKRTKSRFGRAVDAAADEPLRPHDGGRQDDGSAFAQERQRLLN